MIKTPQLLIVDDEADIVDFLVERLRSLNFGFVQAKNGTEALELLKTDDSIIAVLSDINMPGLSGLELMEKTRGMGLEVPFVFITGFSDKKNISEALRLGALDFVDKPFQIPELIAIVKNALRLGLLMWGTKIEFNRLIKKYDISPDDQKKMWELQGKSINVRLENSLASKD